MNIKMILTDLDHTLLHSDGSISEYTKQILKKCQSHGNCRQKSLSSAMLPWRKLVCFPA